MKKVLFIDRDGTLIYEPEDFQVDTFEKVEFLPQVFTFLGKIAGVIIGKAIYERKIDLGEL